jgi:rare lipoprotein A (peptidoglycan hydrolase)
MPLCGTIGFSVALFLLSATAFAENANPTQSDPTNKHPSALDKGAAAKARMPDKLHPAKSRVAKPAFRQAARRFATAKSPDRYIGPLRSLGPLQVGRAAWYGGEHVGMKTASGTVLDSIHPTAAHRTLPLNSLARVTNMKNGRSIIVVVNDRGPVSPSLIIDLSPNAARALDMMRDGIIPVTVEPLAVAVASATAH